MKPVLALLLLASAFLAGCADGDEAEPEVADGPQDDGSMDGSPMAPQSVEVMAMNNAFSPQDITIHVGDSVHWVDHDALNPHNVVSSSSGNSFRSPDMDATLPTHDRDFTYTFNTAGTVDYLCEYHSGMVGTIVVEA